ATTFAEAPFETTANSQITLNAVLAAFALGNYADAEFSAFFQQSNAFDLRQSLVKNYYVQDEFLQFFRAEATTIYGISNLIEIGGQPISRALDLHSMNLHLALLLDDNLRQASLNIPELIPELINKNQYATDPNSASRDFVTKLVADQLQGDLTR